MTHLAHLLQRLLLPALLLCIACTAARAANGETITAVRRDAHILPNGQLAISTRFHTELPGQLQNALQQGVPLDFDLSYRLEKPRLTAYRYKLAKFVGSDSENNTVRYRLAFQPITKRYRLSADTFSNEYEQLDSALNGIGAIAGWQVLQPGALTDTPVKDIRVKVRLKLSTAQLPKPFQINALTKGNWQLDSDWQRLHIHR